MSKIFGLKVEFAFLVGAVVDHEPEPEAPGARSRRRARRQSRQMNFALSESAAERNSIGTEPNNGSANGIPALFQLHISIAIGAIAPGNPEHPIPTQIYLTPWGSLGHARQHAETG